MWKALSIMLALSMLALTPALGAKDKKEPAKADKKEVAKAEKKEAEGKTRDVSELKTEAQILGYVFGMSISDSLKRVPAEIDLEALILAIRDATAGVKAPFSDEEAQQIQISAMMKAQTAASKENQKVGATFLAENGKVKGVVTTKSGLQHLVLEKGKGDSPKATDKVKVHYKGTLIDGTEFDSSYKRGEPATFPLNGVIKGWTEGIQLMNEGGKSRFFIPSDLAYGKQGSPPVIGPDSVLIFDVELLGIE